MDNIKIAIDGPAGAGKSTVAKKLSQVLKYQYVDTGAMYRAIALKALQLNADFNNHNELIEIFNNIDLEVQFIEGEQITLLDGINVNDEVRRPEVAEVVSIVASITEIRKKTAAMQRDLVENMNVIMDGRDITTFVLPDAQFKFYITASVEERAKRRVDELKKRNIEVSIEDIKKNIQMRDYTDSNREFSPLKIADDAILIDTTNMSIDNVLNMITGIVNK